LSRYPSSFGSIDTYTAFFSPPPPAACGAADKAAPRTAASADAAAVISRNARRSIFAIPPSLAGADYSDAARDSSSPEKR
jgi:hypothetical protein